MAEQDHDSLQRNDNRALSSGSGSADLSEGGGQPAQENAQGDSGDGSPPPAGAESRQPAPEEDAEASESASPSSASGEQDPAAGGASSAEPPPESPPPADEPEAEPAPAQAQDGSAGQGPDPADPPAEEPSAAPASDGSSGEQSEGGYSRSMDTGVTLDQSIRFNSEVVTNDLLGLSLDRSIELGFDLRHETNLRLEVATDALHDAGAALRTGYGELEAAANAVTSAGAAAIGVSAQTLEGLSSTAFSALDAGPELAGGALAVGGDVLGAAADGLDGLTSAGESAVEGVAGAGLTGAGTLIDAGADAAGGAAEGVLASLEPATDEASAVLGSGGPSGFLGALFTPRDEEDGGELFSEVESLDLEDGGLSLADGKTDLDSLDLGL